jgi:hypothetical protein
VGALDTVLGMFEESLEEAVGALDTITDMALEVSGHKKISPVNKACLIVRQTILNLI